MTEVEREGLIGILANETQRLQCVGTLSVSGPTTRLTTERVAKLAPSARLVADELSRQLGFDTKPAG